MMSSLLSDARFQHNALKASVFISSSEPELSALCVSVLAPVRVDSNLALSLTYTQSSSHILITLAGNLPCDMSP